MKSRLLKKFKPTLGMPDLRERYLRPGGMADGGVADAMSTANSMPNPNVQANQGMNPNAGGPTADSATSDSASSSKSVYPTPPSSGGSQPDINSGPLALQPMNLTQAPRVAKGGPIKKRMGGRIKAHVNVKVPKLHLDKFSSGIKPIKGMKSGGVVRGCGIASKGKTKGRMV
jgi:hypothetical protein